MFLQVRTENKIGKDCEPCWQAPRLSRRIIHSMPTAVERDFRCQIAPERPQTLAEMSTSTPLPRILIADDQEEMLRTIAVVLGDEFDIIGTAENGKHAVELATTLLPDVLVLDISMPIVNGIEAAWRLRRLGSLARIVFLTVHTDSDFVEAARSTGALGYVWKESLARDLAPAIRAVMQGNCFTSPFT
jgi:CheY-like chemotaxis protein